MTRTDIIARLIELPLEIAEAEVKVLELEQIRAEAATALQRNEDELLLGETINGKNAEQRAAQVRSLTVSTREYLTRIEQEKAAAAVGVRRLTNELCALKAAARLLATTE